MFTKRWWKLVGERAIKTAAQAFITAVGTDALGWLNLDWKQVATIVAGMTALSIATSIATTPFGDDPQDPSLV